MLRLASVRAIVALADTGTIRGAARQLGLSQSALTKSLKELEIEAGGPLFNRSTTGTTFTPAGEVLIKHARLVLTTLQRGEAEARFLNSIRPANVRMNITPTVALVHARQIVARFYSDHPTGCLEIDSDPLSSALPRIISGELDFSIAYANSSALPEEVAFEPLTAVRLIPTVSHVWADRAPQSWDEAMQRRWVINHVPGSADQQVTDWMRQQGWHMAQEPLLCRTPLVINSLLADGFIGLVPRTVYADPIQAPTLFALPLNPLPPPVAIGIIWHRMVPLPQAALSLVALTRRIMTDWGAESTSAG
ncbi:LysR family transcriptional regulator [Cereibacter sphaeroides]|nr:LysR family transcriptional regulator [Cereibacter sphaeroides]